jgi:hypothetical protein
LKALGGEVRESPTFWGKILKVLAMMRSAVPGVTTDGAQYTARSLQFQSLLLDLSHFALEIFFLSFSRQTLNVGLQNVLPTLHPASPAALCAEEFLGCHLLLWAVALLWELCKNSWPLSLTAPAVALAAAAPTDSVGAYFFVSSSPVSFTPFPIFGCLFTIWYALMQVLRLDVQNIGLLLVSRCRLVLLLLLLLLLSLLPLPQTYSLESCAGPKHTELRGLKQIVVGFHRILIVWQGHVTD